MKITKKFFLVVFGRLMCLVVTSSDGLEGLKRWTEGSNEFTVPARQSNKKGCHRDQVGETKKGRPIAWDRP
jgi:hypothetical protein